MRKLSLFVGLTLFALAGSARAQDEAPAVEPAAPAAEPAAPAAEPAVPAAEPAARASKMQVGIAFLPMLLGKAGQGPSGDDTWSDLSLAYGVGLSFGYNVIAGLSVGIAPQALFRVKSKDGGDSMKEYDIMARIAYAYTVIPKLAVYAEFLPGYSIVSLPSTMTMFGEKPDNPKGLVIGFGAGAAYDITDQFFANLGVGYQMGFQKTKTPVENQDYDLKTKFLRIAVGGGMKF
jgi:hypothetical protein